MGLAWGPFEYRGETKQVISLVLSLFLTCLASCCYISCVFFKFLMQRLIGHFLLTNYLLNWVLYQIVSLFYVVVLFFSFFFTIICLHSPCTFLSMLLELYVCIPDLLFSFFWCSVNKSPFINFVLYLWFVVFPRKL